MHTSLELDRPAAPPPPARRRRRPRPQLTPYLLALPSVAILAILLVYPLGKMLALSFQRLSLRELFSGAAPPWVGFANYRQMLSDGFFWTVVARTVAFAAIAVTLSVLIGLLVALLMRRVDGWVRIIMTVVMMFVWAMPQLVATQVFKWLVDSDFGVLNWVIDQIPGVDFGSHSWWIDARQGWSVILALVLWGAIPFLAITLYAGLSQVPRELTEAATVDGANGWQVFRNVTLPILRPLLSIVTTLSVIWDMGVFTQIYVIRGTRPELDYYNLGIYAYVESFQKSDYSLGSAIAVLTVLLMLGVMAFYVRQMFKIGDAD